MSHEVDTSETSLSCLSATGFSAEHVGNDLSAAETATKSVTNPHTTTELVFVISKYEGIKFRTMMAVLVCQVKLGNLPQSSADTDVFLQTFSE